MLSVEGASPNAGSSADGGAALDEHWRLWAERLGVQAPKVELQDFELAGGASLRGMCAAAAVAHDEPVIVVPAERVLQVTTAGECPLDPGAVQPGAWRALPWWGQLAVLLLHEVERGNASPLRPWLDSLPRDFASLPLNWAEHDLESLRYPALARLVAEQRRELAAAHAIAAAGCAFEIGQADFAWAVQAVRSRAFSGPYEGRGAGDRAAQLALVAALLGGAVAGGVSSLEDALNGAFVAALAVPLTDFLVGQSGKLRRHVVCPVIDYLNHDGRMASDIAYEYFADEFAVRVRGGFRPGEQVCINYGEERSNDALLQYYGFVEEDNPHDTYELELLQHLDAEASAAGEALRVTLGRGGPDEASMATLRDFLADDEERRQAGAGGFARAAAPATEALVWRAVALACAAELRRVSAEDPLGAAAAGADAERGPGAPGDAAQAAGADAAGAAGAAGGRDAAGAAAAVVQRFRSEKAKVLRSCLAHAEARQSRPASAAPLSLASGAAVLPQFEAAEAWRHAWADSLLGAEHAAALRETGFCVVPRAFDARLASRCLAECEALDAKSTVTTNPCNSGSRSLWLEFDTDARREALQAECPALLELACMLAGLPGRADDLQALPGAGPLRVHPAVMVATYPERAAEYAVHKDSYAPKDADPATGGTRRLTALAYVNDWRAGDGGELRLHEAVEDQPLRHRFEAIAPEAGSLVLFDSPRVWHAVAPSARGPRRAVTLWVH